MPNPYQTLGNAPITDDTDYLTEEIQFDIDSNMRTIAIPSEGVVIGVQGDKNVNRVNFRMPAWYNGFDMSTFQPRINFVDPEGNVNYYTVTDMKIYDPEGNEVTDTPTTEDIIYFTWLVDSYATNYVGTVVFNVRFTKFNPTTHALAQAFNTTKAACQVLEGITLADEITQEQQEDLLFHMTQELQEVTDSLKLDLEDKTAELLDTLPDDYTTMDSRLTKINNRVSALSSKIDNNLVDPTNFVDGKIIGWNNKTEPFDFEGYTVTGMIPVETGKTYTWSSDTDFINWYGGESYDSFISTGFSSGSMTPPSGAKYLMVAFSTSAKDTVYLVDEGIHVTVTDKVDANVEKNNSLNLINSKCLYTGAILWGGTRKAPFPHTKYDTYSYTNYITVTPGNTYTYNSDGWFINKYSSASITDFIATESTTSSHSWTCPTGCTRVRLSFPTNDKGTIYFKDSNNNNLIASTNTTDGALLWSADPTSVVPIPDSSYSNYCYTDFIEVCQNVPYRYEGNGYFISCYTEANYESYISTSTLDSNTNIFTPTVNTKYITLSYVYDENSVNKYFYPLMNSTEYLDVIHDVNNGVYNKRQVVEGAIVWSTSSPTNGAPDTVNHPDYCYTAFIKVTSGIEYHSNLDGYFINKYTSNKWNTYQGTDVLSSDGSWTCPDNCEFVVLSFPTQDVNKLTFKPKYTPYEICANIPTNLTAITIGTGKQYTTLKEGIAAACAVPNSHVIVYPGTYDLISEFGSEAVYGHTVYGIPLSNGVTVEFMAGSYVVAENTEDDTWVYTNFQPFYSAGDFTLIGANITATNTRYCVHDEHGGYDTQHHVYKDCVMKYINTFSACTYVQCIGGGLGEHGYIEIIGGCYTTDTVASATQTAIEMQQPISYHNGQRSGCDGKIFIRDVYLGDKGHFRFGKYGPSTTVTPIYISGCSMGAAIDMMYENSDYHVDNFSLTEWNNTIRS